MNFLVDAHLPRRLARMLREEGHDALHTLDLPNGNRTTDEEINELSIRDSRVVISKDADFADEKTASGESIVLAREEALSYFASERERYMRLSREEAIKEIIKASKIEGKERAVQSVSDRGLLEVE